MIKEILTYPTNKDILTQKSEEIDVSTIMDEEIQNLITDLKDTLHNTSGIGISAIQIGVAKRVCIIYINNKDIILINPIITRKRGTVEYMEGCLSAPKVYQKVTRSQKVWIDYIDEFGNKKELSDGGLCSIIAQHELDHFDGWCEVFNAAKEA